VMSAILGAPACHPMEDVERCEARVNSYLKKKGIDGGVEEMCAVSGGIGELCQMKTVIEKLPEFFKKDKKAPPKP
jgi:hypothetical protein